MNLTQHTGSIDFIKSRKSLDDQSKNQDKPPVRILNTEKETPTKILNTEPDRNQKEFQSQISNEMTDSDLPRNISL